MFNVLAPLIDSGYINIGYAHIVGFLADPSDLDAVKRGSAEALISSEYLLVLPLAAPLFSVNHAPVEEVSVSSALHRSRLAGPTFEDLRSGHRSLLPLA